MVKKNAFIGTLTALLLLFVTSSSQADEAAVRASLERLLPGLTPDSVEKSAVVGLYEVGFGPRFFYVSDDGRYLLRGQIIDTATRRNLTEAKEAAAKKVAMDKVADGETVVFGPDDAKHTITVFTDIDCGYCRKLHREMEDYNDEGIRVRYLFYPRSGVGSPSYDKAVSVWCADDRKKAMTDAKTGKPLDAKTCDNPVKDHLMLGELMGVNGTPAIVLEDGQLLPGYVPAKRMAQMLDAHAAN
jgi:thiol:disulfide interchange protein DsbC